MLNSTASSSIPASATNFKARLRAVSMKETFGSDNPPGVFVRSDTNVEDLAGFTGAGLNLTMPNVVGYENLLHAISEVWALAVYSQGILPGGSLT